MDCRRASELIEAVFDARLDGVAEPSGPEASAARAHLVSCPACQRTASALEALFDTLGGPVPPPPDLDDLHDLAFEPPPVESEAAVPRPWQWAGAALLAAGLATAAALVPADSSVSPNPFEFHARSAEGLWHLLSRAGGAAVHAPWLYPVVALGLVLDGVFLWRLVRPRAARPPALGTAAAP